MCQAIGTPCPGPGELKEVRERLTHYPHGASEISFMSTVKFWGVIISLFTLFTMCQLCLPSGGSRGPSEATGMRCDTWRLLSRCLGSDMCSPGPSVVTSPS